MVDIEFHVEFKKIGFRKEFMGGLTQMEHPV